MLDPTLREQLAGHLDKIVEPVRLVAALDDGRPSQELADLLGEIAELSHRIAVDLDGHDHRRPSFRIERVGTDVAVTFAGLPLGHEFTSLVLALLQVGGHPSTADPDLLERIRSLEVDHHFETYFSLSCQICPDVVQALNLMSILNPRIRHTAIDGGLFPAEVDDRKVMAVPSVFCDGEPFEQGRVSLAEIVDRLDTDGAARQAAELDAKEPFDTLVVGGGPAGASAAVYASRKGIRTGVVAERFGGQVLDTLGIENLISVPYTEGPELAAALEEHVRHYDVDIMDLQRAERLLVPDDAGDLIEVVLANGATLSTRSVVLSTGARWREMGVPGEAEYRNKGVAYCPHCDGPLYKGKRVAVIGGGNSGIEAAIVLAGIVDHVTVLEFADELRADDVLQRSLARLPNVTVHLGAQTTEVLGDGEKVTGLRYLDRAADQSHTVELDGIFVQIGLLPNTEWLDGTVELSNRGEIVIDGRGATSVPGVFAAGDCTTVPYKQIVVALGAGSTAALSAFDHLIRAEPAAPAIPAAVAV